MFSLLLAACAPDPSSTPRLAQAGPSDASIGSSEMSSGITTAVAEEWLTPSWEIDSNLPQASFGYSVASAGDINGDGFDDVVVGAPDYFDGFGDFGTAAVFLGSTSGLEQIPSWFGEGNDGFGSSVASAGDVNDDGYDDIIIGATRIGKYGGVTASAAAWHGSATGLSPNPVWESVNLGWEVASAGDVNGDGFDDVIIGASWSASVFLGGVAGLDATETWTVLVTSSANTSAGDVNADGYDDVLVGDQWADDPEDDEGAAFVYLGSVSGPESTAHWTGESNEADAFYGWSVSSAGDVNGDGFSDIVVGAPAPFSYSVGGGAAYVYLGATSGLEPDAAWTAAGDPEGAAFGGAVASAGDLDGDGFDDIVVGEVIAHTGYVYTDYLGEGHVMVFLGSDSGLGTTEAWTADRGDFLISGFGHSVASAGDVNGDGFADLAIGEPGYASSHSPPDAGEGRALVYHGSSRADPTVAVVGYAIVDLGDGDGIAERGEEIEIVWSVENAGTTDATNVSTTTSTSDADLIVTVAEGAPLGGPDIVAGASDEVVGTIVEVADDCATDHDAEITVVLSWDDGLTESTFVVPVVCDLPLTLGTQPWVVGQSTSTIVTGALPLEQVFFVLSTRGAGMGAGPCPPFMNGACFDVLAPFVKIQPVTADANGVATWTLDVPGTVPAGAKLWLQAAVSRGVTSNVAVRTTQP